MKQRGPGSILTPEIRLDLLRRVLRVALDPAEFQRARLAVGQQVFHALDVAPAAADDDLARALGQRGVVRERPICQTWSPPVKYTSA